MKFLTYNPEQAYLLPPSVREVLGEDHICFFVHQVVERLELSAFEQGYVEEGRPAYHPALLLKVWLYAYALGVTSARRLEQRVREDLAFRYLAAGAGPDFWTLNQFRTRHARALNDLFTQVVELARSLGMGRLGHVAMDSTRVAANASRDRVETVERRCRERPQKVSADSGFFCLETIVELAQRGLDVYVPDSNLARELNRGQRAPGAPAVRHPEHRRMRRKLRDPAGRRGLAQAHPGRGRCAASWTRASRRAKTSRIAAHCESC